MSKTDIPQTVVRRTISATPVKAGRRTNIYHAGARVTVAHRGPLHCAARRITS